MNESDTVLIISDVQEKLIAGIKNKNQILSNIKKLVAASSILNIQVLVTQQNPQKLGSTLKEILPEQEHSFDIFDKLSFSSRRCEKISSFLKNYRPKNVLICGVETHICVQQTCLDLTDEGYKTFIAVDAIGSRNLIDHDTAINRLRDQKTIITTTEAAIFEWCKTSDRKEFKSISTIIKS